MRLHTASASKLSDSVKVGLLALLIITGAILPLLISNKGHLLLVGDHMSQQIPFMKESRRILLSGTPFWSWNTFLGCNYFGSYSFYVYGSPFFWPLLLIKEDSLTVGISVMFILKHVTAALTAHLYLKRHIKTPHFRIIGSLLYAFSSFSMDASYYYHFLDVIAFFPLVLYYTDEVLENRKMPQFALAVLLNAVVNYYFFVSTSLFFLIYLVFRCKYSKNYTFRDAVRCIVFFGIGALSAMIVLLPSALCLLETKKATGSFTDATLISCLDAYFRFDHPPKVFRGILLPHAGVSVSASSYLHARFRSCAAFLPLFGGLFFVASFFKKNAGWSFKLVRFLSVVTLIPLTNAIFSLFTAATYTRWWCGFVLMMVLISLQLLEENEMQQEAAVGTYKKSTRVIAITAVLTILLPFVVKFMAAHVLKDWLQKSCGVGNVPLLEPMNQASPRYFAVVVLLTAANYVPLWLALKKGWLYKANIAIILVVAASLLSYGAYIGNETNGFERKLDTYQGLHKSRQQETVYESRNQHNTEFINYAMIVNKPGISTFHSFKSHATYNFARLVGYRIDSNPRTDSYYTTEAIQAVLNISSVTNRDLSVQKAPYYVPMGYAYSYYVPDEGYGFSEDPAENNRRIEQMVCACYLDSATAQKLDSLATKLPEDENHNWKDFISQHRQTAATDLRLTSAGFTAVSHGDTPRLLYFSVPHDSGWTATRNGKPTEIHTINGGMMGIVVPAGRSDLEFCFVPPGLKAGTIISMVSLLGLGAYVLCSKLRKKTTPEETAI